MHPGVMRADQYHCNATDLWRRSPETGKKQMSHSLSSVLGKTMGQFLLKVISKNMKDKKVTLPANIDVLRTCMA